MWWLQIYTRDINLKLITCRHNIGRVCLPRNTKALFILPPLKTSKSATVFKIIHPAIEVVTKRNGSPILAADNSIVCEVKVVIIVRYTKPIRATPQLYIFELNQITLAREAFLVSSIRRCIGGLFLLR